MSLRDYQIEANAAILRYLKSNYACLVKMFCGTGKTKIMVEADINKGSNLILYVFPSLQLIEQFDSDYLSKVDPSLKIRICSDSDDISDTNIEAIVTFLNLEIDEIKYVLTTYQSLNTCYEAMDLANVVADVTHFDEAHHCTADTYRKLIFGIGENIDGPLNSRFSNKQIFYTATPRNDNGVIMFEDNDDDKDEGFNDLDFDQIEDEKEEEDDDEYSYSETASDTSRCDYNAPMCGPTAYEYSYYQGMTGGYLNPFDINIDLYANNTTASIYESIARAVLTTCNTRVLTFHADVNSERDTSVTHFVDETEFQKAYLKVADELSCETATTTPIRMVALHAGIIPKCIECRNACKTHTFQPKPENCCRFNVLRSLDATSDGEVMIVSSCQTIGEGVDTKSANMVVFVDPKSSIISITQNIGRIVRKIEGCNRNSTILLPCWVDKEQYKDADTAEKRDNVIRKSMRGGNFNGILNVMSAIKQDNPELHDLCLYYPDMFTKREIQQSLNSQNCRVAKKVGDGGLVETVVEMAQIELDGDNNACMSVQELADVGNVEIEIHTQNMENPIETVQPTDNSEEKKVVRVFREKRQPQTQTQTQNQPIESNDVYYPIISTEGTLPSNKKINPPEQPIRSRRNVHADRETMVLWDIVGGAGSITNIIGSCSIECSIVENELIWRKNHQHFITYMDKHGRRPRTRQPKTETETVSPEEIKLGTWVNHQIKSFSEDRTKCKYCMKTESCWLAWNDLRQHSVYGPIIIGNDNEEIWHRTLQESKMYMDKHGRRPRRTQNKTETETVSPEEIKFGTWVSTQIANFSEDRAKCKDCMKTESCWLAWNDLRQHSVYGPIIIGNDGGAIWHRTLQELKMYMDKHGRRPRTNQLKTETETVSPEELKLGRWVFTQIKNFSEDRAKCKDGMKTESCWLAWNDLRQHSVYGPIIIGNVGGAIWHRTLQELKMYMDKHGRRPRTKQPKTETETVSPEELKLGSWVYNQNKNFSEDRAKCKQSMKTTESCWLAWNDLRQHSVYGPIIIGNDNEEIWHRTLQESKMYMDKHGRRPRIRQPKTKTETVSPEELKLGRWVFTQIKNFSEDRAKCKQSMKTTESCWLAWNDLRQHSVYGPIIIGNDGGAIWHRTLQELKMYMNKHGRRPRTRQPKTETETVSPEEIKLGTWVNHQIKNFSENRAKCKYCMKTTESCWLAWNDLRQHSVYGPIILNDKSKSKNNKPVLNVLDTTPNPIKKTKTPIKSKSKSSPKIKVKEVPESAAVVNTTVNTALSPKVPKKATILPLRTNSDLELDSIATIEVDTTSQQLGYQLPDFANSTPEELEAAFQAMRCQLDEQARQLQAQEKEKEKEVKRGYQSTNGDDKDLLNQWFVKAAAALRVARKGARGISKEKIIVLDHTEFKSVRALIASKSATLDQIIVPQYDPQVFETMRVHPKYGKCVRLSTLENVLETCAVEKTPVRAVYADLTYAMAKARVVAGLIRETVLVPGAVIGLTVSLRNPDGSGFVNQDVSELTALMYSTFNVGVNVVQENSMDGACMYVYGKCTRMATSIIQIGSVVV